MGNKHLKTTCDKLLDSSWDASYKAQNGFKEWACSLLPEPKPLSHHEQGSFGTVAVVRSPGGFWHDSWFAA